MSLYNKILSDLKSAMLNKEADKLLVLRSIKASIMEKEIAERKGDRSELSEDQVVQVLMKAAKQRKDSISQFEAAGRDDLAEVEKAQLIIIDDYLPKMMSEAEIQAVVDAKVKELSISSPADMGKLMGALMKELKGKADGALINKIAKSAVS